MSLSQAYVTYLPQIEAEMRAVVTAPDSSVVGHYAMMQYHLGWLDTDLRPASVPAGKRIRPLLCLLACAAVGGDPQKALPAAAGLELLHNFSLIHDDIEDNSPIRRHRPAAWKLYGMPQACNAGDGMFSLAHLAFHRLSLGDIPRDLVLEALRLFDEMCLALTEGQYLDMCFEARLNVTVEEYFRMISGKTGALFAAAPQIGALIGGAKAAVVATYWQYGAALGRAFQLQDDILGIWGDEALTGKSVASDILSKKKSLPVVYGLAHPQVGPELARLYAGQPFSHKDLPGVLALLDVAGARAYVQSQVEVATAAARHALDATKPSAEILRKPGMTSESTHYAFLRELLDSLVGRFN